MAKARLIATKLNWRYQMPRRASIGSHVAGKVSQKARFGLKAEAKRARQDIDGNCSTA